MTKKEAFFQGFQALFLIFNCQTPALVGTAAMYFLFGMILYANDGRIVFSEIIAMGVCFGVILLIGIMVFLLYRFTVRNMKKQLDISA